MKGNPIPLLLSLLIPTTSACVFDSKGIPPSQWDATSRADARMDTAPPDQRRVDLLPDLQAREGIPAEGPLPDLPLPDVGQPDLPPPDVGQPDLPPPDTAPPPDTSADADTLPPVLDGLPE